MDHYYSQDSVDARNVWGHRFNWTHNHQTGPEINHLLYSHDKLATDALDRLDYFSPPSSKGWKCPHGSGPGQRDLYELLKKHASSDEILGQLWKEASTVPEWVDWEQIERGQQVVYQFSGQVLFGLLYQSLLGGMGAYRVVETLSRTGGFGVNVTRRRLLETLQHFMEVVEDIDSIKPGTIAVYSVAIVFVALPRQGVHLNHQQTADYLALWRYVGYLLGTPTDWMATPERAKVLWESIAVSEVAPSANSRILANNILTAEARAPPLHLPREVLAANAYRLNGDQLASALGIEKPNWRFRAIVWLQCVFFFFLSYSYPWLPTHMQKERERKFKHFANFMIHNTKAGGLDKSSIFDFQYLPRIGMLTELGMGAKQEAKLPGSDNSSKLSIALKKAVLVVGSVAGAMAAVSLIRFVGISSVPRHMLSAVSAQQSLVWAD
ncbi:latex clearing protein [Fusarium langsethiae]|uniref:Latex clearing protein n=1 Tax=Fusarium langsethiae TaxID=179993 RepID=A0A0M9F018_FUSLA|nr:latex clearing protein [Fusarium langsethiae]GKU01778.1 unnamed protein product [Fusarium langsethiae]GKU16585.1 unnamed protein product [Fusarium langsethiae]